MYKYLRLIVLSLLLFSNSAYSQEIVVDGGFIQDDMKLGSPIQYYLKATYPKELEVLFPDKNHVFDPFEIEKKDFFPSLYDSIMVRDSAIYTLTSFEIDKYQKLALPIYLISKGDSSQILPPLDSIMFIELVAQVSDTTSLKTNLDFLGVPLALNTTYLYIAIGIGASLVIVSILIFGLKISASLKIRKIKKNFLSFINEYDLLVNNANNQQDRLALEKALIHWKKYLEKLDKRPYTKLTTKQVIAIKGDTALENALQSIDQIIYGKSWSNDTMTQLDVIRDFARIYQERKIAAIKNG